MKNKDAIIVNQKLKQLAQEGIKDIYFEERESSDQYLHVISGSQEVIFGVNDLGVWIKD